jgi:hypothetical protein
MDVMNLGKQFISDNAAELGPIAGFATLNPYSKEHALRSRLMEETQRIGKALEGGVLREDDIARYKQMLPTIHDTPDNAILKLNQLQETLEMEWKNHLDVLEQAGYNAGGMTRPPEKQTEKLVAGQIVDGYRFKGGDSKNPDNWEMAR